MQKGSICFFIQKHLDPFCDHPCYIPHGPRWGHRHAAAPIYKNKPQRKKLKSNDS